MKARPHALHNNTPGGIDHILFSEFRNNPTSPVIQRVETVLSLMVAANTHLHAYQRPVLLKSKPEFIEETRKRSESKRSYLDTLDQLGDALKRYHWRSTIEGDLDGFRESLGWSSEVKAGDQTWEYAVVRLLLDRMRVPGEIARFRRCSECQNWLYAVTSHQRFCGEICRRHYTSGSPEFKEKRRNYMKQVYRPQQKKRDIRQIALAKETLSSKRKGGK